MDQIYIVSGWFDPEGQFQSNGEDLNELLSSGKWKIKEVTPFSSYGYGYGAVSVSSSHVDGAHPNRMNAECQGSDNGFAAIVVLTSA